MKSFKIVSPYEIAKKRGIKSKKDKDWLAKNKKLQEMRRDPFEAHPLAIEAQRYGSSLGKKY